MTIEYEILAIPESCGSKITQFVMVQTDNMNTSHIGQSEEFNFYNRRMRELKNNIRNKERQINKLENILKNINFQNTTRIDDSIIHDTIQSELVRTKAELEAAKINEERRIRKYDKLCGIKNELQASLDKTVEKLSVAAARGLDLSGEITKLKNQVKSLEETNVELKNNNAILERICDEKEQLIKILKEDLDSLKMIENNNQAMSSFFEEKINSLRDIAREPAEVFANTNHTLLLNMELLPELLSRVEECLQILKNNLK